MQTLCTSPYAAARTSCHSRMLPAVTSLLLLLPVLLPLALLLLLLQLERLASLTAATLAG
jgi:hypothetical protein